MWCPIGAQDKASNSLSEYLLVFFGQLIYEIVFDLRQQPKKFCHVEGLLCWYIVRGDGPLGLGSDMEAIGKSIMAQVMGHSCRQEAENIDLRERQLLLELVVDDQVIAKLHDLSSMQVIVVCYILSICPLYPLQKHH